MAVKLIAHTTVGAGGSADITLSSIPSTYDDLWLVASLRQSTTNVNGDVWLEFNSDTGSNYSSDFLNGTNNAVSATNQSSQTKMFIRDSNADSTTYPSTFTSFGIYIPRYSNSSYEKQIIIDKARPSTSASVFDVSIGAGLWRNTAAINAIKIIDERGTFVQYSSVSLYGITKF